MPTHTTIHSLTSGRLETPAGAGATSSIDQHANQHPASLAEHTFDQKAMRRIGTKSLGSAQCFQGFAKKTWRENARELLNRAGRRDPLTGEAEAAVCGRGGDQRVGDADSVRAGGCVGDPGAVAPVQRHARSRTVRRLARSSPEVPSARLIRKLRARRAALDTAPLDASVPFESTTTCALSSRSSGTASTSLCNCSRVGMPQIVAPVTTTDQGAQTIAGAELPHRSSVEKARRSPSTPDGIEISSPGYRLRAEAQAVEGPSTAAGVFTRNKNRVSQEAIAGKPVNRRSPHPLLRSLTLNQAGPTSPLTSARPTSSLPSQPRRAPASHPVPLPRDPKTREQRRLTLNRTGAGGVASEITNAIWATTPVSNESLPIIQSQEDSVLIF
jgi:hypothetical protein